jgi:hypothetical protein
VGGRAAWRRLLRGAQFEFVVLVQFVEQFLVVKFQFFQLVVEFLLVE